MLHMLHIVVERLTVARRRRELIGLRTAVRRRRLLTIVALATVRLLRSAVVVRRRSERTRAPGGVSWVMRSRSAIVVRARSRSAVARQRAARRTSLLLRRGVRCARRRSAAEHAAKLRDVRRDGSGEVDGTAGLVRRGRLPGRLERPRRGPSARASDGRNCDGRRGAASLGRRNPHHRALEPGRRRARRGWPGRRPTRCRSWGRSRHGLVHHHHRPLELGGGRTLQVESALRALLCRIWILRPTVRAEHACTSGGSIPARDRTPQGNCRGHGRAELARPRLRGIGAATAARNWRGTADDSRVGPPA